MHFLVRIYNIFFFSVWKFTLHVCFMRVFSRYNFFKISYGKLGHLKICISFSNALTCNTVVIVPDLNTASSVVKSSWRLYNYNKNGFCWISLSLSLFLSVQGEIYCCEEVVRWLIWIYPSCVKNIGVYLNQFLWWKWDP